VEERFSVLYLSLRTRGVQQYTVASREFPTMISGGPI
jgi:hypothetical protein